MQRTNYYGLLDSVRFAPHLPADVRARREVAATGAVMIDVLAGGAVPVLSQTQAFDSAVLLNVLEGHGDDTLALLRLVERSRLQVRVVERPRIEHLAGPAPESLLNAFALAVQRPGFMLSGWPELTDAALRRHVLDVTIAGADVDELGSERLAARLEGLRLLDAALTRSEAAEKVRAAPGGNLFEQVLGVLDSYEQEEPAHAEAVRWLRARALSVRARRESDPGAGPDLGGRSGWYVLLDELSGEDELAPAGSALRSVVDEAYNGVIAVSLGVTGSLRTCTTQSVAKSLADLEVDAATGALAVDLAVDPRHQSWLTWTKVGELSDTLTAFDPPRRVRYLEDLHIRNLDLTEDQQDTGGRWALPVGLTRAFPILGSSAVAAAGEIAVGGGVPGIGLSAVVGVVALYAAPVIRDAVTRRGRSADADDLAPGAAGAVTTGTAKPWRTGIDRDLP